MDHRPSPNEVNRIEKEAMKQEHNEEKAGEEVQIFLENARPLRSKDFPK